MSSTFHKSIFLLLIYLLKLCTSFVVEMDFPEFLSRTPNPSEKDLFQKLTRSDGFCSKAAGHDPPYMAPVCTNMVPNHKSKYGPQPTSTCPWKFYLTRGEISESFSHPVIIGAVEGGTERLRNFMVAAKQVEKDGSRGRILGHWEYQWDTIPFCCYDPGLDYSYEGRRLNPNLLISRRANPRMYNQSLMWTAPHHFEGQVVFQATFWKSWHLTARAEGYPWTLIFTSSRDGFSLNSLYRRNSLMQEESPVMLLIQDTNSRVFGALVSCSLHTSDSFYGTGQSFLFTLRPEFKLFKWTGENLFFVKGNHDGIWIGAGDGKFGLYVHGDLNCGRTEPCQTYGNGPLTEPEDFIIRTLECWAFGNYVLSTEGISEAVK